ncbi:MAG: hypothetical protein QME12_00785 [Nanoarchaeota archaeon]|nr:hypothetical protein [Nanoarchaeota archaeon]
MAKLPFNNREKVRKMEESTSWVTYALIILAVLLVVGIMVYKFYPETFSDISKIAEEVFKFGEDAKKSEALQIVTASTIHSIMDCLEKSLDNCGCELNMEQMAKLPEGYKVFLQNRLDKTEGEGQRYLLVAAFDMNDAPVGEASRMNNLQLSLALHAKWRESGKNMEGVLCRPLDAYELAIQAIGGQESVAPDASFENMLIEKKDGKIVFKAGKYGPYSFYHEGIVLQMHRLGNNVCFVTEAINGESVNFGDLTGRQDIAGLVKFAAEEQGVSSPFERNLIMEELFKVPRCKGVAGMDYSITWPAAVEEITGINSCGTFEGAQNRFSRWVKINVKENNNVISPIAYGVVTDYCDSNCGDEGKSVTIYELHSAYETFPSANRLVGRVVKIAGLKTIDRAYKARAQVTTTGFTGGAVLKAGDTIGASTSSLTMMETYKRNNEVEGGDDWIIKNLERFIGKKTYIGKERTEQNIQKAISSSNILLCLLPKLPAEYYAGSCTTGSYDMQSECKGIDRTSLAELANEASAMEENSEPAHIVFPMCKNCRIVLIQKDSEDRGAPCSEATTEERCMTNKGVRTCETVTNPRSATCDLPHRCPEGETCICEQRIEEVSSYTELQRQTYDLRRSYCARLPPYGFQPVFARGTVNAGDRTVRDIWLQRAGSTLGICETFPCIR